MTRVDEQVREAGRHDLARVLTGLRLRVGATVEREYSCGPPQVMAALTAVTLSDLVAELPGPVRRITGLLGRLDRVAGWLALPVFTCALALGGSLPTTDPLRFMLLEARVRLRRGGRDPALVSIGVRIDPVGPVTRARVLLLGADRRNLSFLPSNVIVRSLAPVWRPCVLAWLTAAARLITPDSPRPPAREVRP